MEQHINTYQGMNKDTAYDSLAATFYIDALDVRITTTTGDSLGGFTNIKGNSIAVALEDKGDFGSVSWNAVNPVVIGYATIRTKIILFVADDSDTQGWIYNLEYNPADKSITSFGVIYYNAALNFKKEWPIEALGRYEAECTQRVYWTDYNNFFRSLNVVDPNLTTLPLGLVDIFPDVKFRQPLLTVVSGGGILTTGIYQIAYRLSTADGKQTLISPPGNILHIVTDSESGIPSNQYNGNNSAVNSGKSISITLDTSTYGDFDKIEFISIYKSSTTATTEVMSVEEINISNQTEITFIYTGGESSIFDLELLEFLARNYAFKTPKTITQKDNSLLIANIKESVVSLQDLLPPGETFYSKTRRYNYHGEPPFPIDPDPLDPSGNNLQNAFNTAYNSDAHWNEDWHKNDQYRYQSDGKRLGGEGPNISYNFYLEEFTLDETSPLGFDVGKTYVNDNPDAPHDLNDGYGGYANTTFPNHASPFISGLLRGYKRGETYRFGIVFYTNKGETTFVEYIGDIKFPDISEKDSVNNNSGYQFWPLTKQKGVVEGTFGYSMGIEFNIDFSTCPGLLDNITGYQIVRVKRENVDKRRLAQGIIKGFHYNPILDPYFTGGDGFNLKINDDNNVVQLYPYYPPNYDYGQLARANASFATLQDSDGLSSYTKQYRDYLILGSYLGFYCPEISYDKNGVSDTLLNLGNNPCLLITGAYTNNILSSQIPNDWSSIDLGQFSEDIRLQYWDTHPVNFNTIQSIKKWKQNSKLSMDDTSDYTTKVTTMFSGYYMRNYWCMDDWLNADIDTNPNRPQAGTGHTDTPEFFKGGTSIIGKVEKITTDFFTNNPITGSAVDYFDAPIKLRPLDRSSFDTAEKPEDYFPIVDALLPKQEVYGGYTQNSLEANVFMPASPIISPNDDSPRVFGGDVFLNMFVVQTGMADFNKNFYKGNNRYWRDNSRTEIVAIESDLNLELANGATLRTGVKYEFSGTNHVALRQETNNKEATYAEVLNMYNYNSVYSRQNDDLSFYVQPADLLNCGANDIRAYLSNVKINEENIDAWTKFGVNNYYDVDDYGPINKVINWKDTVYFIQDKGIGAYAINRAAVTTTADGVPTQLGTGLGFGKHIYYSKVHGAIHQWAVETTEAGIYFFDAFHRKIFMMQAQSGQTANSAISEIKGMHSFLQSLPTDVFTRKENGGDNPILGKGVNIGKDIINDEVMFTFMSKAPNRRLVTNSLYTEGTIVFNSVNNSYYFVTNTFTSGSNIIAAAAQLLINSLPATAKQVFNSDTLVFDELAQQFSSRYSMTPTIWIQNGDIILTPDPLNQQRLFTNGIGDWGVFYDIQQPCELTLIVNPQADVNKILRTMEFNSIVRDNNKIIDRGQTISAFRISTQYQDTNVVPFSPARFKRKFDKWRLKIPRDQNSANQQGRLRSTYFVVTLYFDNSQNKELIMNRLMSYFDYQVF